MLAPIVRLEGPSSNDSAFAATPVGGGGGGMGEEGTSVLSLALVPL